MGAETGRPSTAAGVPTAAMASESEDSILALLHAACYVPSMDRLETFALVAERAECLLAGKPTVAEHSTSQKVRAKSTPADHHTANIVSSLGNGANPNEVGVVHCGNRLVVNRSGPVRTTALAAAATWWWTHGGDYHPVPVVMSLLRSGADSCCTHAAQPAMRTALWQLCALHFDDSPTAFSSAEDNAALGSTPGVLWSSDCDENEVLRCFVNSLTTCVAS